MNHNKHGSMLFYLAAACFYAAAVITFFSYHDNSRTVVWICMGIVMITLGAELSKKQ